MWIGIVSLMPEMFTALTSDGVVGRGIKDNLVSVAYFNPREFTADKHRNVDDRPFGGGAGMVMMVEPLAEAVKTAKEQAPPGSPVVLLSPQGETFTQRVVTDALDLPGLILICGRYEGVDERFIQRHVDAEWSVGDFVVSGGELPAMLVIDAIARHIPGVLGNRMSIIDESHLDGRLDYPQYTRPEDSADSAVPPVLMSGDHTRIQEYRRREALKRTFERRPEYLTQQVFSTQDRKLLIDCFENEASNAKKQDN